MQLFLKILSGMANSVDLDQIAPSGAVDIWVCSLHRCSKFPDIYRTYDLFTILLAEIGVKTWIRFVDGQYDPQSQKTYLWTYAPSKDSVQPTHLCNLIRFFTGYILDSQGCKVSSC